MMNHIDKGQKKLAVLKKELQVIERKEEKLKKAAQKEATAWKKSLESKIPPKVLGGLKKAFYSAFATVFEKGISVIEKTYSVEERKADHQILDYALDIKGGRRELRKMQGNARKTDAKNMLLTTVEGVGLGALGVGIPDIVVFVGMLLKGIYETALLYGFDYNQLKERYLILKMMEVSICKGEAWIDGNLQVEKLLRNMESQNITEELFQQQMKNTAEAFATDLLVLKFVQGLPIVGIVGGAANPIYYKKVMDYVALKYQKRYVVKKSIVGIKQL